MESNKIIHEGSVKLGGTIISCYVLEDGTRVLSSNGMQNVLNIQEETNDKLGMSLSKVLSQKNLEPFLYKDKEVSHYNQIECYKEGQKVYGYEATILEDICNAFLEAKRNISLTSSQKKIADHCEVLIKSFARCGIIPFIDESTRYQYNLERFEIQKILNNYISDKILKWQLTFTDDFYKQAYRLWGLPFIPKNIKTKPSFIGKLTITYIYEGLPKGIFSKTKENTGNNALKKWKYNWHQSITPEIGREHLKKQIIELATLMEVSQSKEQFDLLFKQKYNKKPIQLDLEFYENYKEPKAKGFNKKLKEALEYNHKNKE